MDNCFTQHCKTIILQLKKIFFKPTLKTWLNGPLFTRVPVYLRKRSGILPLIKITLFINHESNTFNKKIILFILSLK